MDKNYGYKHTKGFLAFIVFTIVLLLMAPAFAQSSAIDITGNLVNNTQTATPSVSTWQNAKFVNSLTCWAGGDPNCSAGQPYIRPDGNINFSYGYTELYQTVNVSKALPNSGTGLVTTGFTFSWRSKNGNGWDDGRLDELKAYVQGYSKSGQWIENFNYNLNFKHDWTDFTWNENWSKLRRPTDLANVLFGFAGKDNNYWMGPYGPEITNVNFQIKYKPDPCVTNPLYSPECPKFQETLQKNLASTTTTTEAIKPSQEFESQQPYSSGQPKQTIEPMIGEKEEGVYEEIFHVDMNRLIDTLIKIEDNQNKEQQISLDAASSATRETEKISQQTVKQAEQIASRAVRQSVEIGTTLQQQVNTEQTNKENKAQQSLTLFQAPSTVTTGTFQLPNSQQQFSLLQSPGSSSSSTAVSIQENNIKVQNTSSLNLSLTNSTQPQTSVSSTPIQQNALQQSQSSVVATNPLQIALLNPLIGQVQETPTLQSNFLLNKTDPINSIIENKPSTEEKKQDTNIKQVKSNVQDNDAAAGVSLDSIARTPVGFNTYLVALNDAAFYAPKEIYRNQKTIDNVRALRQLAGDRLHQQMVDLQYRK